MLRASSAESAPDGAIIIASPCRSLRHIPANTRRWPNAGSLPGQRLRRLPGIEPALDQRMLSAGGTLFSGYKRFLC